MKTWKLLIAALVLIAVSMAVRQTGRPAATMDPLVGRGLMTSAEIDLVKEMILRTCDGEVLVAREDGNWVIPGKGGFPADTAKIEDLFQKVTGSRIIEMVTSDPARHEDLGVAKPGTDGKPAGENLVLSFNEKKSGVLKTIFLGKGRKSRSPDGSVGFGTDGQYVRIEGLDSVYLLSERIWGEKNLARWLKSELFKIETPEIKRISWDYPAEGEKDFSIGRELTSEALALSDLPADHQMKTAQIDGTAKFFGNVALDDVVPVGQTIEREGFANPVTMVMETFKGMKVTMRIGTTECDLPITGKVNLVSITASSEGDDKAGGDMLNELAANGAKFVYAMKNWRVKPLLLKHSEFMETKPDPKSDDLGPTDSGPTDPGNAVSLTGEAGI